VSYDLCETVEICISDNSIGIPPRSCSNQADWRGNRGRRVDQLRRRDLATRRPNARPNPRRKPPTYLRASKSSGKFYRRESVLQPGEKGTKRDLNAGVKSGRPRLVHAAKTASRVRLGDRDHNSVIQRMRGRTGGTDLQNGNEPKSETVTHRPVDARHGSGRGRLDRPSRAGERKIGFGPHRRGPLWPGYHEFLGGDASRLHRRRRVAQRGGWRRSGWVRKRAGGYRRTVWRFFELRRYDQVESMREVRNGALHSWHRQRAARRDCS
jgi:hypothetical protein